MRWPRGRPLPPVRLGERASGPPNEGVERVDITRAFGEFVEELLTLRSVVEQFSFALAPGGDATFISTVSNPIWSKTSA